MLYQLIIHVCSKDDIRENIFSANFPSVSVFQCEASEWSVLGSGRMRLRCPDSKDTCPDACGLSHAYKAT
jgi:hypothetical protein